MFKRINVFLIKRFIKNWENTSDPTVRASYGYFEGYASIIGNFVLFLCKLLCGLWINSISVIADAFHSLSDVLTSIAVVIGFKISKKPQDKQHPYGYGRAEYIASFVVSFLLIIAGIEILKGSINKIMNPEPVAYNHIALIVILLTALVKEWYYHLAKFLGIQINSNALIADAWHHRSDALSSLLIAAALYGTKLGFTNLDGIFGIIVSLMIMYTGYEIIKDCSTDLIGRGPTDAFIERLEKEVLTVDGAENLHQVEVHRYGPKTYVNLHVEVQPNLTALESHQIADRVMKKINKKFGISALVHIDVVTDSY